MSLILEALNRADRDRSSDNNNPSLQAQPYFSNQHSTISYLRLIEIIVIIVMAILLSYKLLINNENDLQEKREIETPDVIETTKNYQPPPIEKNDEATHYQPSQAVQSLYKKTKKVANVAAEVIPLPKAVIKPVILSAAEIDTPYLSELNTNIQKNIPTIDYNQHVFLDDSSSFIEINKQLLLAGQAIPNGLNVISISEEFVTLSYRGIEFKLQALNSWVNFD